VDIYLAAGSVYLIIKQTTSFVSAASEQYSFIRKWGFGGVAFGQFSQPLVIAIDSAGNVYVRERREWCPKVY
jgi:hypothetical protein